MRMCVRLYARKTYDILNTQHNHTIHFYIREHDVLRLAKQHKEKKKKKQQMYECIILVMYGDRRPITKTCDEMHDNNK